MSSIAKLLVAALFVLVAFFTYFHFSKKEPPVVIEVPRMTEKVIGSSVEGRPIKAYMIGNGDKHILFVGGVHGGYEWNSSLLAYKMLDHFANQTLPKNISIAIVPDANPDGTYKITKKNGEFAMSDIAESTSTEPGYGRFNARGVDLNRNFDCKWKPKSTWRSKEVSAGTAAFSEPESQAIREFVVDFKPEAVVFWHSQANAVYASECEKGILPGTLSIMEVYSKAAGYPAVKTFDAYPVSGDAEGWLASINIPAITVELKTHNTIEWEKNLAGVTALISYLGGI